MTRPSPFKPSPAAFAAAFAPGLLIYAFVVFAPLATAFGYSLTDWTGGPSKPFIGLGNFLEIAGDGLFLKAFANNLVITAVCVAGQIGIALALAFMLSARGVFAAGLHRSVVFFPAVLSAVIVGFVWSMLYNRDYGLLNRLLGFLRIAPPAWLDDPAVVLVSVSLPLIWQYVGYYVVIILAGMTTIPQEVLEMAEVDGAGGPKRLVSIVMPLLRPTLAVCLMLCISGNMQVFDHVYVLTGGGPGTASMVMAMYAYQKSFGEARFGYGSAVSVAILVLSFVLIGASRLALSRKESA